jgi:hypothetical protein
LIGEECSTHDAEQKCVQRFGKPEGNGDLEDMNIGGRIILKLILKKQGGRM